MKSKNRSAKARGAIGKGGVALAAVAMITLGSAAHANNYSEGAVKGDTGNPAADTIYEVNDLSSVGSMPTNIGALTFGDNFISGATIPYGPVVNTMTQERQFQDNDYIRFRVANGDVLSGIDLLANGSSIKDGDLFFVGIASGDAVNVTPPSSVGLLGYSLISSNQIGSDILPALGASAPAGFSGPPFSGATTFNGPLPSGTYSLWLLDGDNPVHYNLDLQVSSAPEPATWALMLGGVGILGAMLRLAQARRREDETTTLVHA